jgi:holo-[acyl-carrier protein] synthase
MDGIGGMLIGLGQDIQHLPEFSRAENLIHGDAFFSEGERSHAERSPRPLESYAGMFCAKEALFKAVPLPEGIRWTDIEVVHGQGRAPRFRFHGDLDAHFRRQGWMARLSISHSGDYAAAVVGVCLDWPRMRAVLGEEPGRDA